MNGSLRVLFVEDNAADVDLIREILSEPGTGGFVLESVPRLSAALERLERGGIDLLLVDLGLPDSQGLDTFHRLQDAAPRIPVIVLTGNLDQELAVRAVRDGAQDFLVKGHIVGNLLERAARYAVERKRAEGRERLGRGILELLNRPDSPADTIRDILQLIKKSTAVDAVGIRLRDGDDFPYYQTNGFAEPFLQAERSLCRWDAAGNVVRGSDGNPVLECMCGTVICGRTDPTKPFFTADGSFWTNGTTHLLATTTEQDRQARTRNRCNGEGYESVALVPLRSGTETIGLLQLNDRRPGRFTLGMIRFFEGLGSSIGIALSRKRAEDEIRRLVSMLDVAPSSILIHDPEGRIVYANQRTLDKTGYAREEFMALNLRELLTPESAGTIYTHVPTIMEQGADVFESEYRRKDGSAWPVQVNARRTMLGDRQVILSIATDLTERKRAESALRASEMRYRRLFEAARDGILILDAATGKIVDVNPFLIEQTGYSREEFLDRHVWEIGPFHDVAAAKESFAQLQVDKYVRYDDLPLMTRDGRRIAVEFVSNVYLADDRQVIQCNIRDVTERKRAETERAKLEDQLRAAQKMEAIGSLAGGIAHDFNNLLSVILSYSGFVLEGMPKDDPRRDDLLQVKKAGERAAALTRQLLAFGRKQVLQPVPLDLNRVLADMAQMLRRIIGEDVDLERVEAADVGLVTADPGQVERVIMNLVVNARDAMPEGGKLTLETSNVELDEECAACRVAVVPGSYVMLAITDAGCGMDEQTKARLFEPFFTTKVQGKGTGLGLSTVYGIVKQSGGNISVYSELGKGTTVKVYLPRELTATTAATLRHPVVPRRTTGTETILVVEDEEVLREVARRALGAAGYEVLTAADADGALRLGAQYAGDIQLLLTDVMLPGMNGVRLARELRETRPAVKVLYMSGYTDDAITRQGPLDAETQFLSKPFTALGLTWKVREVLDGGIRHVADGPPPAGRPDDEPGEPPLDKHAVGALPVDLLGRLRRAVVAARHDELVALVETTRSTQPEVATGLRWMADAFDYDGLRSLLGP